MQPTMEAPHHGDRVRENPIDQCIDEPANLKAHNASEWYGMLSNMHLMPCIIRSLIDCWPGVSHCPSFVLSSWKLITHGQLRHAVGLRDQGKQSAGTVKSGYFLALEQEDQRTCRRVTAVLT